MLPYKQKGEVAAKLMRREDKIRKKPDLIQETMSIRKPRQKDRGLERNRREKWYDWIAIYFEKLSIGDIISMSSVYMTCQV